MGRGRETDASFFNEDVEIQKIIKNYVEIHRPLKKEMEDYLVSEDTYIEGEFQRKRVVPIFKTD